MKTRRASALAVNTTPELETAHFTSHHINSSRDDLVARLDRAHKTIRTLEQRVAMQERTYMAAMQEKNRKIRELQMRLQAKQ